MSVPFVRRGVAGMGSAGVSRSLPTSLMASPAICAASLMNMSFVMAVGMMALKMA